jgi:2,4-dienoyl-CoA reductase (NADPH2)
VEYEKIIEEGVVIMREGKRQTIPADTVVVAAGAVPEASLVGALLARGLETYPIGDCVSPGKIANALREAAWVGREI